MLKGEYFFWRGAYVAIKPASIVFAGSVLGEQSANLLAFAVLLSGTLMASLSLGTYKNIFKYTPGSLRTTYFQKVRSAVFMLNFVLLGIVAGAAYFSGWYTSALFFYLFVVAEHVVHDDSRIYLYSGDRVVWARSNCFRTLFIPMVPIISALFSVSLEVAMAWLFILGAIVSFATGGLFRLDSGIGALFLKRMLFLRYISQFNYFIASTSNRFIQQSDKFIFSILSYEMLWVYTIVCQIANIPLMFFEMSYMSAFKAKIARSASYAFSWLTLRQAATVFLVTCIAVAAYAISVVYISELKSTLFIAMFITILVVNFASATSMQNSESLFWAMSDKKRFAKLEMKALMLGHLVAIPIMFFGVYALAKVPNFISVIIKVRNSKKWLNCTNV